MFDLRTIAIAVAMSNIVFFFSAWFLFRITPEEKSLRDWTTAAGAATIGSSFMGLRGLAPDFLVIVVGNSVSFVALALVLTASRSLLGVRAPRRWIPIVLGLLVVSSVYFTYVDPNLAIRIVVISFVATAIYAAVSWVYFRHGADLPRALTVVTSLLCLIAAVASAYRGLRAGQLAADPGFVNTTLITGDASIGLLIPFLFALTTSSWFAIMLALVISYKTQLRLTQERDLVQAMNKDLRVLSTTDGLTGLVNRGHCDAVLYAVVSAAHSRGEQLAVALIDLDHFKRVNDTYGHEAGDDVLREAAQAINFAVRSQDTIGRWGGEEFLAILPGAGETESLAIAERIRAEISEREHDVDVQVTASVGVASLQPSDSAESLVRRADDALYAAKHAGRDRVCASPPAGVDQP